MTTLPKGGAAVMAQRREPPDSLDFFCTPPWATRALCEIVLGKRPWISSANRKAHGETCWEPACGEGHMAEVLGEYFPEVQASDVHDYGKGYLIGSFIGHGPDVMRMAGGVDWVVTNPPFNLGVEFALRALETAKVGVALLLRTVWAEGGDRYLKIFRTSPPSLIAQFCERVPMTKGRWDPDASTATSYSWFVWRRYLARHAHIVHVDPARSAHGAGAPR